MPAYNHYLERFFSLPRPSQQTRWIKIRNEMRIHTQGSSPADVLLRRHPHEDEASFRWRLDNYVPITKPLILRALHTVSRILEDSVYGLEISNELSDYLSQPHFFGTDFFVFCRTHLLQRMIEDPNGRLVWLPTGEGLTDESQPVSVIPVFVSSEQIRYAGDDAFIFLSEEKSNLYRDGGIVPEGEVYYLITPEEIVRIAQAETVKSYNTQVVYRHRLGRLPVLTLRGDAVNADCYESYFSAFLSFANEAIRQFSDWQAVMATNAFPIKEIQLMPCAQKGCHGGYVGQDVCSQCDGKGYEFQLGPFSAMLRPYANPLSNETPDPRPMLRYITPPTEIIRYAQESWEILLQKAEEALALRFVYDAQSGVAKIHDREELYTLMAHIGSNLYDYLMAESLRIIEGYRNPFFPQAIAVHKPVSYHLQSAEDLQADLARQIETGAAPHLILQQLGDWSERLFGSNPAVHHMTRFLIRNDRLLAYSHQQLALWREKGWITDTEWNFHHQAPAQLNALLHQIGEKAFITLTDEALREAVR